MIRNSNNKVINGSQTMDNNNKADGFLKFLISPVSYDFNDQLISSLMEAAKGLNDLASFDNSVESYVSEITKPESQKSIAVIYKFLLLSYSYASGQQDTDKTNTLKTILNLIARLIVIANPYEIYADFFIQVTQLNNIVQEKLRLDLSRLKFSKFGDTPICIRPMLKHHNLTKANITDLDIDEGTFEDSILDNCIYNKVVDTIAPFLDAASSRNMETGFVKFETLEDTLFIIKKHEKNLTRLFSVNVDANLVKETDNLLEWPSNEVPQDKSESQEKEVSRGQDPSKRSFQMFFGDRESASKEQKTTDDVFVKSDFQK